MIIAEKEIKLFETNDETIKEIIASMSMMNGKIELKVDKDGIISAINQSAEKIKINAGMIDLDGYVTISSLSGNGTTTIDGSNIKTGLISADRLDIDSIFAKDITATGSITGVTLNGVKGTIASFEINDTNLTGGNIAIYNGSTLNGGYVEVWGSEIEDTRAALFGTGVILTDTRKDEAIGTFRMQQDSDIRYTTLHLGYGNKKGDTTGTIELDGYEQHAKIGDIRLWGKTNEIETGSITASRDLTLGGNIYLKNGKALLGMATSGEYTNLVNMSSNDNVVIGYGGRKSTNIYGGTGIRFLFKEYTDDNGNYIGWKPYYEQGDSVKLHWDGAGYITNAGTYVKFTIPLSRPILMIPPVTVANVQGMKIRQNGNYLYGSSAEAGTKKITYEASANKEWVRITAIMQTADVNAINNASCGIEADIEIMFN